MAENSNIQWTHHSFSTHWGCTKIPQVDGRPSACDFCYAERDSHRWGHDVWGKDAPRRMMSDDYWKGPLKWNRKAQKTGERKRVFCSPMSDICEDRPDLDAVRTRLIETIEQTPFLDWLLLSKRPFLYTKFFPWKRWPRNVWAGTTTEDQHWFDHRMKALAQVPADIRFVSAEPLFSKVDISAHAKDLQWVITGSESGWKARITEEEWIRDLKNQCVGAGIPFFYKQFTKPDRSLIHTPELDGRTWLEVPATKAA